MGKLLLGVIVVAACSSPAGTTPPPDASADAGHVAVCGNGVVEPGEQCDDGNTISGDGCTSCNIDGGHVTFNWDIKTIANVGVGCPSGYDTAAIYSQQIDANDNDVGPPVVDLFDCAALTGMSDALIATTYNAWVQIENHDGSSIYASSIDYFADLAANDKTFTTNIYTDGGYFEFAWQLTSGGVATTCAANPDITGIESVATEVGNAQNSAADIFHCADHYGITDVFAAGSYTVSVDAINASNMSVGTSTPQTATIMVQNRVTNLGTVSIPLN